MYAARLKNQDESQRKTVLKYYPLCSLKCGHECLSVFRKAAFIKMSESYYGHKSHKKQ